ncbi:MAG: acetate/propionate family kinase [Planctomycetaceae bacterium]|nr:acetate/propionate family kinase [Planctomycetaceae bacterium]
MSNERPLIKVIVVLNSGSSSVKFSLFELRAAGPRQRCRGQVQDLDREPRFRVEGPGKNVLLDERFRSDEVATQEDALHQIVSWVKSHSDGLRIVAVGHRVAHGGPHYAQPVLIDQSVIEKLASLVPLAPLHQPHNLAPIRAIAESYPELIQVACFDTAFHRTVPLVGELFGLPMRFFDEGVRRYGFHGLSFEYVASALRELDPVAAAGRLVIAHLGNGCSMAALKGGVSLGNTMSFTGLDGLPMGTRCGQIDPGVLIYLMHERGMSLQQVEHLLYHDSGLKRISGISHDMRDLLASDQPSARVAIDYFVDQIGRSLGSLAAVLKGLDALVFTGGIGEHAVEIRARVAAGASWLGVEIDQPANQRGDSRISAPGKVPSVWVIPTDEELMIARHVLKFIGR